MRRQDIQLRTLARQGDCTAKLLLAKMYLLGSEGMARNIPVGLDYAQSAAAERPKEAAELIACHLPLELLMEHHQLPMVRRAASSAPVARIKLALCCILEGELADAALLLQQSSPMSDAILAAFTNEKDRDRLINTFRAAAQTISIDILAVALLASQAAQERKDLARAIAALALGASFGEKLDTRLHAPIADVVCAAEEQGASLGALEIAHLQQSLERLATQGNIPACYALGRALCGFNCGVIPWERLVLGTNIRKGCAYLLRAADAGTAEAWLHLFRISSDYRSSAANAQMARFCLEKAAACGIVEAQRRLGALEMREAETLSDVERAVDLLFVAAQNGDAHAASLMGSLVLQLPGRDADAQGAVDEVGRIDPWLAARLRLSRHFGLTKLEALSLDPASALRPWGLVIGPNPYVTKAKLSAPRAVPALTKQALHCAREAAALFSARPQDNTHLDGTFRQRSANQRRLFERLRLDESLFFSTASSSEREALRIGSRWAHRCRSTLRLALNDS